MKLSVVMGVFNGEEYLSKAIDSILSQSYRDFEFIIVDDGSTDSTGEILHEISRTDSRVVCVSLQKNVGLPRALNLGIQKASGSIIARMDCDDVSMPERFEQQLKHFENTGVDVLGTFGHSLSSVGRVRKTISFPVSDGEIKSKLPFSNCLMHPSVMIRKSALESVNGYDEEYLTSQDYDLWLRLIPNAQMGNLEIPLVGYRKHNGRISAASNKGKQTHYSVCAAVNYFRTAFNMARISPKLGTVSVINGITELYQNELDPRERQCLNRHIIRYARYCVRDGEQRNILKELLFVSASLRERRKWNFYQWSELGRSLRRD